MGEYKRIVRKAGINERFNCVVTGKTIRKWKTEYGEGMRRFVGIASALLAGLLPVLQLYAFVPREAVSRQPSAVSVEQAFSLKVTTERRDAPGNFSAPSACSVFEPHSHVSQLPHFHTDALTHFSPDATNTYHAVRDHLGSVCVLVDSTGATKEQYRYGAWGETQILNASGQPVPASSCGSRFLFHGGEYSEATGLYRFRARWYAPELGRWLSPDPIGLEGGLNLYEFCGNNPVNNRDPSGLVVSWAFVGVGALGNLGAYALSSWVGNESMTAGGITGALAAGAIAGATAGLIVGDASAAGVAAIAWGAFGGGFGGAVGGAIGSAIQQGIDQGDVCLNKVGHDALISGLGGALGGGITGRFLPESLWRAVSVSTLASAAVNTYDNIASQIQDALNRQASSYRNNPDYWDNLEKFGD